MSSMKKLICFFALQTISKLNSFLGLEFSSEHNCNKKIKLPPRLTSGLQQAFYLNIKCITSLQVTVCVENVKHTDEE